MAKDSSSAVDDEVDPYLFFEVMILMLSDIQERKPTGPACFTCFLTNFLGNLDYPDRYETLIHSDILETLVTLYHSEHHRKKGNDYIRYLLQLITAPDFTACLHERASVVLKLCLSMKSTTRSSGIDQLYVLMICRLRDLAEKGNYVLHFKCGMDTISDIPSIMEDLEYRLIQDLERVTTSPPSGNEDAGSIFNDFKNFKAISRLLCHAIKESNPSPESEHDCNRKVDSLCCVLGQLMKKMDQRFRALELDQRGEGRINYLTEEGKINEENIRPEWSLYLPILEELNLISKLYEGAEEKFWKMLITKKVSVRALIIRFASRTKDYDYRWLLEHNDVTDSESRVHLALFMIREEDELDVESIEKLVKWSKALDADLFAFENKKLTDVRVLEDWLCKSSKAIFKPGQKSIFQTCPDDPTRFHLNLGELKAEPFHYDCAEFAGKVIALALIHKVRIGVALDHGFLLQLKEDGSSLDIKSDNKVLVSFFAKGFKDVFGVPIKDLLCFKGLEVDDINQVLHMPMIPHHGVDDTPGEGMREDDVDPLLLQYQMVRKEGRNIREWQKGSKLKNWSFGEVYLGLAEGGFTFAAKKVPFSDAKEVSSIEKEIDLLCQLSHENIVEYFGTKKEGSELYIFLQFVSGGSLDKVYKEYSLDDFQVSCYTKQILEGLKYLHERNVMHGDIRCAKILLNENGCVKIADFGLAKITESRSQRELDGAAPKVYGTEADIRSLGYTVLEMLTREYYYPNSDPQFICNTLSPDSRDFIQKCLNVKPNEGPKAAELLQHPFVNLSFEN